MIGHRIIYDGDGLSYVKDSKGCLYIQSLNINLRNSGFEDRVSLPNGVSLPVMKRNPVMKKK